MERREIEEMIKKRFEKINITLESVRLHYNEDDIRLFRVKVKKLGACLRLLDAAKSDPHSLKIPQRILRYYKVSGEIRNLQIQQHFVLRTLNEKQMELPKSYLNLLSDKTLHHISTANKMIKGKQPFKKSEGNLLKLLPDHLNSIAKEQFVRSEIKILKKLLGPVFPAGKPLHELRKLLKSLLYTWPYIEADIGLISPYTLLSNEENIDSFSIVLGKFHDINGAITMLHRDCLTLKMDESEKTVVRNMEGLWIEEKEAARQAIYQYLQKINNSCKPATAAGKWPVM